VVEKALFFLNPTYVLLPPVIEDKEKDLKLQIAGRKGSSNTQPSALFTKT
jgi:hypothetical protein